MVLRSVEEGEGGQRGEKIQKGVILLKEQCKKKMGERKKGDFDEKKNQKNLGGET